jgi:hypothetical protein
MSMMYLRVWCAVVVRKKHERVGLVVGWAFGASGAEGRHVEYMQVGPVHGRLDQKRSAV